MPRQRRGLFRRGRIWWIAYSHNGRMIRESARTSSATEASALLDARRVRARESPGFPSRPRNPRLSELLAPYEEWASTQKSFRAFKRPMIARLRTEFGHLPVSALTVHRLETYQARRTGPDKCKPATPNREFAVLSHCLAKATEWGLIGPDVLATVRKIRPLRENNGRTRYLTPDEAGRLLSACPEHLAPIVGLALQTGMRRGEILGLKWDHVDLAMGFLYLEATATKTSTARTVPLTSEARRILASQPRHITAPWVFWYGPGRRIGDPKKAWQAATRRAGLTDLHFHDLRHTFASHLAMAGVDLLTLQALLGHKTTRMTVRYTHLAPSHLSEAVRALPSFTPATTRAR
jgi:integrase